MKRFLLLLIAMLTSFFGWQKNVTGPTRDWQKKHDQWEKELKRLNDVLQKAKAAYAETAVGISDSDLDQLWGEWLAAAKAVSACRDREPKCPIH